MNRSSFGVCALGSALEGHPFVVRTLTVGVAGVSLLRARYRECLILVGGGREERRRREAGGLV